MIEQFEYAGAKIEALRSPETGYWEWSVLLPDEHTPRGGFRSAHDARAFAEHCRYDRIRKGERP